MRALWVVLGSYTLLWGVWIGNTFFTAFSPRAGLYDAMGDFMPEWAWGLHAVIVGASIVYGAIWQWPRAIMWGCVANTYHWVLIGIFYAVGDWHNTGALTAAFVVALTQVLWYISRPCKVKVFDQPLIPHHYQP